MSTKKQTVRRLAFSAVMVALSTVLSMIKVWQMPLGGSVTLLSMLPICTVGLCYGFKAALAPCFVYGAVQMVLGNAFGWGLTPGVLIACLLLDYLVPYTCMALSGLFYRRGELMRLLGVALALTARFVCHFVSGAVLWTSFERFNNPYVYSLVYNGLYMFPELVFTLIGFTVLIGTKAFSRIRNIAAA